MEEAAPQNVHVILYCDKCGCRIKPAENQGIKDGTKCFCGECAAALPPARGSQRNISPASPSAPGIKPATRDSRRLQTVAPEEERPPESASSRRPVILIAAGSGLVLVLMFVVWLLMRSSTPDDGTGQDLPPEQTAALPDQPPSLPPPPVPPPPDPPPTVPQPDPPPVKPPDGGQAPAPPVVVPVPPPVKQPVKPAGPTPAERLQDFKKQMDSVTALVGKESYGAAGNLLRKMQEEAGAMPWWKEQEPRWNEAHQKLQQLIQESREEADAACSEAEKAATPAALEALERQWRPKRTAAPAGELTAEWAQKVLDAVETNRRGQRVRLREKLTAQVEGKLTPFEKSMQAVSRFPEAQLKTLAEMESVAVQDPTLVERYGERLAALRWMANVAQEEDLSCYRAGLRKIGSAVEVGFDFAGREQLEMWELDDPDKHGRFELLVPGPGLMLETKHHHEWHGKDRRKTPILRVPFLVRPERWAAEVDVELPAKAGDRPYQGCLTVWDGGQNHLTVMVEESGAKGWTPVLFGCTPNRERVEARATPVVMRPGESVRLQLACLGDQLTATARVRGGVVSVGKDRLGFQPKYLGLMTRTCGDMTAAVNFRDLKIVGVPDLEKIKGLRENRKPAEQKQIVDVLRQRSLAAERVAAGKSFPIPLGAAARVACSSRLKDNRSDDERLILPYWGLLAVGGIPFQVTDPQGATVPNAILLKGEGLVASKMPELVSLPCGRAGSSIHLLSGVSVGGFPGGQKGSHTMTLRIIYEDGKTEEYAFKNGQHFADYARSVDVPESRLAFEYQGRQVRCISVAPKRPDAAIKELEFVKGSDGCAPLVLGVTVDMLLPDAPDFGPPENLSYKLVYDLDLSKLAREIVYDVDNREKIKQPFDRIAYFMELTTDDGTAQNLYVSMDAFTDDLGKIGVPTAASGAFFQQNVTNMNVYSNVNGIVTGTGLSGGNIEFWPGNYGGRNVTNVANANDAFDFGDEAHGRGDGHGSMQVHNHDAKQTLFALNQWRSGSRADLGIGNRPGKDADWTFAGNAGSYKAKRLRILVHLR